MSCGCCHFEFLYHQGTGRPLTTNEDLKLITSTSRLQMSKSPTICLYCGCAHECVMKTWLHNIQCLAQCPPTSEEMSPHSERMTV